MIKYLRLPITFPTQRMLHELAQLHHAGWSPHYNKPHYEGDWSILALRSPGGDPHNVFALQQSAQAQGKPAISDTALLQQCPAIAETLRYFECEKTMVRLMKLNSGAIIKQHTDQELCFESGEVRFHIPLQTNEQVHFYIEEEPLQLKTGECWYINFNLPHRVSNLGSTDRIHLVIDCVVNDWVRQQFALPGILRKDIGPPATILSEETRRQIVEALRLLNTPTSIALANKMELNNGN